MNIQYENTNTVLLETLNPGDIFRWDGMVCMKLNYDPSNAQSIPRIVTLVCGDVFSISVTEKVSPLKGRFVIDNDPTHT